MRLARDAVSALDDAARGRRRLGADQLDSIECSVDWSMHIVDSSANPGRVPLLRTIEAAVVAAWFAAMLVPGVVVVHFLGRGILAMLLAIVAAVPALLFGVGRVFGWCDALDAKAKRAYRQRVGAVVADARSRLDAARRVTGS